VAPDLCLDLFHDRGDDLRSISRVARRNHDSSHGAQIRVTLLSPLYLASSKQDFPYLALDELERVFYNIDYRYPI
jgi:hypothetical protein